MLKSDTESNTKSGKSCIKAKRSTIKKVTSIITCLPVLVVEQIWSQIHLDRYQMISFGWRPDLIVHNVATISNRDSFFRLLSNKIKIHRSNETGKFSNVKTRMVAPWELPWHFPQNPTRLSPPVIAVNGLDNGLRVSTKLIREPKAH